MSAERRGTSKGKERRGLLSLSKRLGELLKNYPNGELNGISTRAKILEDHSPKRSFTVTLQYRPLGVHNSEIEFKLDSHGKLISGKVRTVILPNTPITLENGMTVRSELHGWLPLDVQAGELTGEKIVDVLENLVPKPPSENPH